MSFVTGNDNRDDLPLKPNGKKWNNNTTYESSFCEKLLELCAKGHSFASCSKELGVWATTIQKWRKDFPEWEEAYQQGKELQRAYWENLVLENAVYHEMKDAPKKVVKDALILHRLRCYFDVKESSSTINPDGSITTNDERVAELAKKYLDDKL